MADTDDLNAVGGSRLYRVPFIVGVTGHRDLVPDQLPGIRTAVNALLSQLKAEQPEVRVQLLCSMADGADLLVAEMALEMGLDVLALLTFPEDICRADLLSEESRIAFDRVMARAERLELPLPEGVTRESLGGHGPIRDRQYQYAGLLVARYSSLLIAIWDGKPTVHVAGSARVVEFRQRGLRLSAGHDLTPSDVLLSASDNDLLFDIRCARVSEPDSANQPLSIAGFSGAEVEPSAVSQTGALPASLRRLLARTAEFNLDSVRAAVAIASHGWPLAAKDAGPSLPGLALLDRLFVQADCLGSLFRRRFLLAILIRYSLWAAMASLLFGFEHLPTGSLGLALILGVLAIFAVSRLHAGRAHRYSWHRKYLDYRALAEALRVDYYWEVTGVRHRFSGEFAHESFLQKQDSALEWIRAAMRSVSLRVAMHQVEPAPEDFALALRGWIGDQTPAGQRGQIHYYGKRSRQLHNVMQKLELLGRVLRGLGMLLAGLVLLDIVAGLLGHSLAREEQHHYVLWGMALLTMFAGILESYIAERADRNLIRQYRYMHSLFGYAARQLQYATQRDDRLEVLRSLGRACLAEHAQWTLAQRDRTIQGLKW
jgi:uncharacterized membrane protein YuzA (DUF378 family)